MEIIETITAVVSLLVAVATSVIAILTKLKAIKNVEAAEKVNSHLVGLQHVSDKIKELAIIAEANGGTGVEKKKFVMDSIKVICNEYGWPYDENWIETTLEAIINVTKKINAK